MSELSDEATRTLLSSGWKPGRLIDTSNWRAQLEDAGIAMHKVAEDFLSEFGGLSFVDGGDGISAAREPFEIDPLLCNGEEDRFIGWGELIGVSLVSIGELARGRCFLDIDESGVVYLVDDWLVHLGAGPAGLEDLIIGISPETLYEYYPRSRLSEVKARSIGCIAVEVKMRAGRVQRVRPAVCSGIDQRFGCRRCPNWRQERRRSAVRPPAHHCRPWSGRPPP